MNTEILLRANQHLSNYDKLHSDKVVQEASLENANKQMLKILQEQELLEKATLAIQKVRPLLAANSIKQCEELANSAIESVFGFPYKVEYDAEEGRFMLNHGEFSTDLAESEGGGLIAAISFVFQVYLLIKMERRKFLAFDEAFVQISDEYFPNFIAFLNKLCEDLGIDILLITHDKRIEQDMVTNDYLIKDGTAIKQK